MRKLLIIAAVLSQFAVLAWMAIERESVVRNGRTVYLRTAPIDPTDPMRGAYVRLEYELSMVPKSLCRDEVATWFKTGEEVYNPTVRDRRVYAEIQLDSEGVAEIISLSDRPPAEGLYLRGRAKVIHLSTIEVRFGVEAFFMQQDQAKAFEDLSRTEKAGVPLNMELKVSRRGLAVLTGYRWEPLGITLVLDRPPETSVTSGSERRVPAGLRGLTIELKNHGSTPQAIVAGRPELSFRLLAARPRWGSSEEAGWVWVGENSPAMRPMPADIKLLQPGESHRVHVDLTASEWLVRKATGKDAMGPAVSIESLVEDWSASFRVEYAPPAPENAVGLPHADLIRPTALRSRAFRASGNID
jgi:uncharacterized membrane-anchored protein